MNSKNTTKGDGNPRASLLALLTSGFFIVLPLLLVGGVVKELFLALQEFMSPLMDALPGTIFRLHPVRLLVVCFSVAALLLVIGLLARTKPGRACGRRLESKLLNRVPFYALLRNQASGLSGKNEHAWRPVLVTVDIPGLQQLGFILERHADGKATVFLPSSPAAGSGTVVIVEPARMRELHVPGREVLGCLGSWGFGAAALLAQPGDGTEKDGMEAMNPSRKAGDM